MALPLIRHLRPIARAQTTARAVAMALVPRRHARTEGGTASPEDAVKEMNKEFQSVFGERLGAEDPVSASPPDDPFAVIPPDTPGVHTAAASLLSHVDDRGRVSMVDVSAKAATARKATASASVYLGPIAFQQVAENETQKGDVLAAARVAGISGAKATSTLIPLCHSIPLSHVSVGFTLDPAKHSLQVTAEAATVAGTGVEMEALTAASVAALTVYDMCKAADKGIVISDVRLEAKTGGKSGSWRRSDSE